MDNKKLLAELKVIVEPYVQNKEAFEEMSENTRFIEDLKINSANLVDVVLDVEDKYDIEVADDEMEKMLDVKSSIEIIANKVK